jgi:hypothetical protein
MKKWMWGLVGAALADPSWPLPTRNLRPIPAGTSRKNCTGRQAHQFVRADVQHDRSSNFLAACLRAGSAEWICCLFLGSNESRLERGGKSTRALGVWPIQRCDHGRLGFLLKSPTTSVVATEITIAGEVACVRPADARHRRRRYPRYGGQSNPADFKFGESDLAKNAANGSFVYFWDASNQVWSGGGKSSKGVWASGQSNYVVKATEGFFLKTSNATSWVWTNAKPYTWP